MERAALQAVRAECAALIGEVDAHVAAQGRAALVTLARSLTFPHKEHRIDLVAGDQPLLADFGVATTKDGKVRACVSVIWAG